MRFALAELFTVPRATGEAADGILHALFAKPRRREQQVRAVVESLVLDSADIIVLPGWTLIGRKPPEWIIERSRGRTIVLEMMTDLEASADKADHGHFSYVLQDGQQVVGPERQLLASSGQAWKQTSFTERASETATRMSQHRRWKLTFDVEAMLAICGEINVVHGRGKGFLTAPGFDLDGVQVLVNPSHTRMKPQGARNQRAFLSNSGLTLVTANAHSGAREENASEKTAEVYWNGERLETGKHSRAVSADSAVRVERIWLDDTSSASSAVLIGEVASSALAQPPRAEQ